MTETEKIVAWLRAQKGHPQACAAARESAEFYASIFAERIERGDHRVWKPEPTIPASEWVKTPSVGHGLEEGERVTFDHDGQRYEGIVAGLGNHTGKR